MRIVVLGSTGRTGKLVVEEALAIGREVVAFTRRPEVAAEPGVTIAQGALEDPASLRAAFDGADCVISTLGVPVTPRVVLQGTTFQQRTLPLILSAIEASRVGRFVLMSSFGLGETAWQASWLARAMAYRTVGRRLFEDKALAEQALRNAAVNWSAVYPVVLKQAPPIPEVDVVPLDQVAMVPGVQVIPFANVARELVRLAPEMGANRHRLLITNRGAWRPHPSRPVAKVERSRSEAGRPS
jgi:uncharacterized protein YbjT (DUF2867 family)